MQILQLRKEGLKKIHACTGFEAAPVSQRSRVRIPYKPESNLSHQIFKGITFGLGISSDQGNKPTPTVYLLRPRVN